MWKRRAKTDRLDAEKLVGMLVRFHNGVEKVWSVVHIPSIKDEDNRQLHRELMTLKGERTRQINRIKGVLISLGIPIKRISKELPKHRRSSHLDDDLTPSTVARHVADSFAD